MRMVIFDKAFYLFFIPIIVIGLILFFRFANANIKRRLQRFASIAFLEKNRDFHYRKTLRSVYIIIAVTFIFIALARPQWGVTLLEQKSKGLDIIIALDTSQSMLATDVSPSRLQRAKLAVNDLLNKVDGGDRMGLIAFAGKALLQCPLTLDYDAVRQALVYLDSGTIVQSGTNLAAAIKEASASFLFNDAEKILILITDGEDLEGAGLAQAKKAYGQGLNIFTVGVGNTEGAFIPDPNDPRRNLLDAEGNPILTQLDPVTLGILSEASGGVYRPLGKTNEGLESVYREVTNRVIGQEREARYYTAPIERFQWPLGIAVLFLMIAYLIESGFFLQRHFSLFFLTFFGIGVFFSAIPHVDASPERAKQHYRNGDYEEAVQSYEQSLEKTNQPASLYYNLANTYYRLSDYQKAKEAYQKALLEAKESEDFGFQEKSLYNLGNTHYRLGEQMLAHNSQEIIELWEMSIGYFQSALELNPKNTKAKENAKWVQAKLDALKQEQSQQQSEQTNTSSQGEDQQKSSEKESQTADQGDNTQDSSNGEQQANKTKNNSASSENSQKTDPSPSAVSAVESEQTNSKSSDSNPVSDKERQEENRDDSPNTPLDSTNEENSDPFSEDKSVSNQEIKSRLSQENDSESSTDKEEFDNQSTTGLSEDGLKDDSNQQNVMLMRPEEARRLLQTLKAKEKKLPASQEQGYSAGNKDKTW